MGPFSEARKLRKVKKLVDAIADSYAQPGEEEIQEMRELTGIPWEAEELQMICCDYWQSPHSLDEIAYYLLHEEWPEK